jgi:hypothetical protein
MVAHRDEEVEEQFPALLHFCLHSAAAFECISAADDEGEIVSTELGVGVGSVAISKAGGGENGGNLDAGLKALLAEGKAFERVEAVAVGGAAEWVISGERKWREGSILYGSVLQQGLT